MMTSRGYSPLLGFTVHFLSKMFRNVIGGLCYVFFLFYTCFFGFVFMSVPTLPLLLFKPTWFRWANDKLLRSWIPLMAGILEIFFGMKLFITTENFPADCKNDRAMIVMNHRTRLDWLYYFSVILRRGKLENEKIILKDELKHIPGGGWAMQFGMYVFLQRKWEEDERYLHQILRYFTDNDYPLQLLMFPEGTDYDENTLNISKTYALKNNLPIYNHVLHPRLRGFTLCLEQLKRCKGLDAIHDVTVAYRGNICRSELDVLMGNFPQEVYFHIKRYPIEQIPETIEGLEKWCTQIWDEKEKTLEAFYKNGKFDVNNEEKSATSREASVHREIVFWILYWCTFALTVPVLLYYYSWLRWYTLVISTLSFFISVFGGGFEMLQVWRHTFFNRFNDHVNNYSSCSYLDHSFENGNSKAHTT